MSNIKRKISHEKYLLAGIVTILLFILGIAIGQYMAENRAKQLEVSENAIAAFLDSFKLKEENFNYTNYCNLSWSAIWEEKVGIGNILSTLEKRLGKDHEEVKKQKAYYNEIQYRTLTLVQKVNRECNYDWDVILFFYTNDKTDARGDYKLSEYEGYALDTLYTMYKDKIKIFSFDINTNDNYTKNLTAYYQIINVPTLVINGEIYGRFMSRDEIETILSK